jgi:hypothetical protein
MAGKYLNKFRPAFVEKATKEGEAASRAPTTTALAT